MGLKDKIDCSKDEVLTQQSAKDECDINKIVERAKRGAEIPFRDREPIYGDFTQIPTDLRQCLVEVKKAETAFMSLDAHVRARFSNDPVLLLDFLNNPQNRDEAIKLGLVAAPEPTEEPVVKPVAPPKANSGPKKSKAEPVDE